MSSSDAVCPNTDPAPIFEYYRNAFGSALLTAAVAEFKLFARLAEGPKSESALLHELELSPRAGNVLLVAMKAMGLLIGRADGAIELSEVTREHLTGGEF